MSDYRLVDKKGLKTTYGIPYSHQHIARLEKAGSSAGYDSVSVVSRYWRCRSLIASRSPPANDSDAS
jgi:hypothetical protein